MNFKGHHCVFFVHAIEFYSLPKCSYGQKVCSYDSETLLIIWGEPERAPNTRVTYSKFTVPMYVPGWKGTQASTNIRQRKRRYRSQITARYCSVPPQTIHFRFDRGSKIMESLQLCARSNLWNLGCNTLDRGPPQTSFDIETPLSHFFRTRSHSLSPGCRVQLNMNHMQPPKPLNSAKSRTATTSLRGPFHPGMYVVIHCPRAHHPCTYAQIADIYR